MFQIDTSKCQNGKDDLVKFLLEASSSGSSRLNVEIQKIYAFPATYIAQVDETTIGLGNRFFSLEVGLVFAEESPLEKIEHFSGTHYNTIY